MSIGKVKQPSKKAPTRRPEWEEGGGVDDAGRPNPVPDPQLPAPPRTLFRPGSDKVSVLAARHAAGQALWCVNDLGTHIDYVGALCDLGTLMREEVLSERGLRWLANGISIVPGPSPADPPQYRAQVWDVNINDHIEVGRAATRGEAVNLIIDWARRHLGLDVNVAPPFWIKHCLADAIREYAERNGAAYDTPAGPKDTTGRPHVSKRPAGQSRSYLARDDADTHEDD